MNKLKLVIIGGGFGGVSVAKALKNAEVEVCLVDKANYHLFQPLLYQVATAALSPGDIAVPIRSVLSKYKNVRVIMDEVLSIDRKYRKVILRDSEMEFDYLVIAIGSHHSYFGNDQWAEFAPGIKTLSDALQVRENILCSLELAEKEKIKSNRNKYLTFAIVGGGPTGVEMAGAIAEITRKSLANDFRNIHPENTKIYLIEAASKILTTYPDALSLKAQNSLKGMGVELKLNTKVMNILKEGVQTNNEFIETTNIIWAAGNTISPILKSLDTGLDKSGRVMVNKDLSIKGDPNIFVIGDAALVYDNKGKQVPGIAQGAIQAGKYIGKIIGNKVTPGNRESFHYFDKGNMATIGRAKAVAEIMGLKLSGFIAWMAWCFIHIFYLISFRNRFRVMAEWAWHYITFKNGIRLIVGKPYGNRKL